MTEPDDPALADLSDAPAGLRSEAETLRAAGLDADEALLIAARRLAVSDAEVRAFARERFAGIWDEPEPEAAPDGDERGTGQHGFWVMAAFAVAAAVAIRLPEAFGFAVADSQDADFYARNYSLLVLPPLAGWFVWLKRPPNWVIVVIGGVVAVSATVINAYPFDDDSSSFVLAVLHLPVLLWLVIGLARAGERWRLSGQRMDYVRFTGEWIVYGVLIALAGAVFSALTVGAFVALDIDTRWMTEWVMVGGSAGAVVVTAWLVEFWAGAVSKFASMLAYIFTPLFAAMLVVFLVAVPATGRSIEGDREALILFNVLLGFVVGLLLFWGAARRPGDRPGFFDGASTVLASAGLLTGVLTLAAVIGRIADFGWSPNRAALLGINAIFAVNLAGSVWLYLELWRKRRPFDDIVRWQTAHLAAYAAWAAVVVVAFPPIFAFA
ncbi:MAG: hypothetical protein OXB99_16620 [Acidimicrobiaceae bacterium]|nr:hypothetical protein [Acidimicrobiaceae bacterium]